MFVKAKLIGRNRRAFGADIHFITVVNYQDTFLKGALEKTNQTPREPAVEV
jgi:hypothetical protein